MRRLLLLVWGCCLPLLCGATAVKLPACAHNLDAALDANGTCTFAKRASRKDRVVCEAATDPRLELPRGVERTCYVAGTKHIVTPAVGSYLDEVAKAVLGYHAAQYPGMADGAEAVLRQLPFVLTGVGFRRLHNTQSLLEDAVFRGVPGDFLEAGVSRGGVCLLAAAVLKAYGQLPQRRVWLADPFEARPAASLDGAEEEGSTQTPARDGQAAVRASFEQYGLLSDSIKWLPGDYKETLPKAKSEWTSFAVVRLGGDPHQNVHDSLTHLYPHVSPGGYVIVDGYWHSGPAHTATDTFLAEQAPGTRVLPVFHGPNESVAGAWFRKP